MYLSHFFVSKLACKLLYIILVRGIVCISILCSKEIRKHHIVENDNQEPNVQLQAALITSIQNQNIDGVRTAVNAGANINTESDDGETPMHVAVRDGNLEIVLEFIGRGANLDVMDNDGETPVGLAAFKESDEILRELVRSGANVDITNDEGRTHLHEYAEVGNLEAVKKLLDAGASLDLQDDGLETALCKAVDNDHADVALELLNRGADPNLHPPQEMSVFSTAVMNENLNLAIELLNRGANSEIHNNAIFPYQNGRVNSILEAVRAHSRDISAGRTLKMLANKLTDQQRNGDDNVVKNIEVLNVVLQNGFGQSSGDTQFSLDNFVQAMNQAKDTRENRQNNAVDEGRAREQQDETRRTRPRLG
jgi:ankyrin repeat protein